MKPNDFRFNEKMIALIPPAGADDRYALKLDLIKRFEVLGSDNENIITQNILLDPNGLVIDGRTRIQIMEELGLEIPDSKITQLPKGTSQKLIEMEVKSANIRRNLTLTQKAATATKAYLSLKHSGEKGVSIVNIAKDWGVGKATLENALYISKNDTDLFEALWRGESVKIVNADGVETTTISINSVCQHLKRIEESKVYEGLDNDYEWNANSYLTSQVAKDNFYKILKANNAPVGPTIQGIIISYLNNNIVNSDVVSSNTAPKTVKKPSELQLTLRAKLAEIIANRTPEQQQEANNNRKKFR